MIEPKAKHTTTLSSNIMEKETNDLKHNNTNSPNSPDQTDVGIGAKGLKLNGSVVLEREDIIDDDDDDDQEDGLDSSDSDLRTVRATHQDRRSASSLNEEGHKRSADGTANGLRRSMDSQVVCGRTSLEGVGN